LTVKPTLTSAGMLKPRRSKIAIILLKSLILRAEI
jgi:hypothetical protein